MIRSLSPESTDTINAIFYTIKEERLYVCMYVCLFLFDAQTAMGKPQNYIYSGSLGSCGCRRETFKK